MFDTQWSDERGEGETNIRNVKPNHRTTTSSAVVVLSFGTLLDRQNSIIGEVLGLRLEKLFVIGSYTRIQREISDAVVIGQWFPPVELS